MITFDKRYILEGDGIKGPADNPSFRFRLQDNLEEVEKFVNLCFANKRKSLSFFDKITYPTKIRNQGFMDGLPDFIGGWKGRPPFFVEVKSFCKEDGGSLKRYQEDVFKQLTEHGFEIFIFKQRMVHQNL